MRAKAATRSIPIPKRTVTRPIRPIPACTRLLKWDLYSYKLYDNYTEEEYGWIDLVRNAETFSNACENMLFIGETTDMALNHQTAENDFFQDCLVKRGKVRSTRQSVSGAALKNTERPPQKISMADDAVFALCRGEKLKKGRRI